MHCRSQTITKCLAEAAIPAYSTHKDQGWLFSELTFATSNRGALFQVQNIREIPRPQHGRRISKHARFSRICYESDREVGPEIIYSSNYCVLDFSVGIVTCERTNCNSAVVLAQFVVSIEKPRLPRLVPQLSEVGRCRSLDACGH